MIATRVLFINHLVNSEISHRISVLTYIGKFHATAFENVVWLLQVYITCGDTDKISFPVLLDLLFQHERHDGHVIKQVSHFDLHKNPQTTSNIKAGRADYVPGTPSKGALAKGSTS